MKAAKVILVGVILAALMVPFAHSVDWLGLINYIPGRGGTVNFAQDFTATTLVPWGSLWRWTNMTWLGFNLGIFSIDATTGSTILVTGFTDETITYTVTGAGTHRQYIYYRGYPARIAAVTGGTGQPSTVNILQVTTTGNAAVTVTYNPVASLAGQTLDMLISFFPLVAFVLSLEAKKRGLIGNRLLALVLLIAALGVLIFVIRNVWG